jgi:hypothetical protein
LDTGGRIIGDGLAHVHAGEIVLNPAATMALDALHPGLADQLNAQAREPLKWHTIKKADIQYSVRCLASSDRVNHNWFVVRLPWLGAEVPDNDAYAKTILRNGRRMEFHQFAALPDTVRIAEFAAGVLIEAAPETEIADSPARTADPVPNGTDGRGRNPSGTADAACVTAEIYAAYLSGELSPADGRDKVGAHLRASGHAVSTGRLQQCLSDARTKWTSK